jgi:hypothetical protein
MKIAAPGTPERRKQDKDMITHPSNWPIWPRLPLKKAGEWEHGFVINTSLEDDTVRPRVYLATIFDEVWSDKFVDYEDIDAILDDGWTVD